MKRPESTTSPMRAFTRSATAAHWAEGSMSGTGHAPDGSKARPAWTSSSALGPLRTEIPHALPLANRASGSTSPSQPRKCRSGLSSVDPKTALRACRDGSSACSVLRSSSAGPSAYPLPTRIRYRDGGGRARARGRRGRSGRLPRVRTRLARAALPARRARLSELVPRLARRPRLGRSAHRLLRPARLRRLRGARRRVTVDARALRPRGRAGALGARPRTRRRVRPQLRRHAGAGVGAATSGGAADADPGVDDMLGSGAAR